MDRIPILSKAACLEIVDAVNSLQAFWITRHEFGFYSLGAAAYLDAPPQKTIDMFKLEGPAEHQYMDNVEKYNGILSEYFSSVYVSLKDALSAQLNAEVEYAPGKALPGFHIFNHSQAHAKSSAHVPHYDGQYEGLDWGREVNVSNANTFSFTLPVKLPKAGGGIYFWPIRLEEILQLRKEEALKLVKAAKSHRESYQVGEMICHPGHQLHRIAPWVSEPGDQRMTLQGHGLYLDNRWLLYW
jgi:hypothetical protein